MINTIRERVIVKNGGKIEISSPELEDGKEVEVFVLLGDDSEQMDETEYLLSNMVNREILLESVREAEEHPERHVVFKDINDLKKHFLGN